MAIIDRRGFPADQTDTATLPADPGPGLAIKTPCRAATTANIALSGLQTIDGVTLTDGDRVLVKDQTDATTNGIYSASSGNWTRTDDWDGTHEIVRGTHVLVTQGTINVLKTFSVTADDPLEIGTSSVTISELAPGPELAALAALGTTGLIVRAGVTSYATRTLTGTSNRLTVTNGDGVSGNPTLDISSSYVGQATITTLGTIGTGAWQGTAVAAGFGGTGQSSYTIGDLLYASGASALSKLAAVATGNALISGGTGTAPSWGKIGLTTHVSGTLAEGNGGTNQSTYTTGDTLYASASNTLSKLSGNTTTTRKFLRQTGNGSASAAPAWDTILAADVPGSALTRTNDTNVTLTLGGSPTTALLNAASLTLGWTGTLPVSRGGTGAGSASGTALDNISGFASTGMLARTASGTYAFRTITGTANELTVTNGDGVSGTPTLSLPSALTFTGKTVTGGTFSSGAFNGTVGATTPSTGAFTTLAASGLISANGGQIAFPATANPSSNVNTLDDYEEGTWTPGVAFGGASTGTTYDTDNRGTYTKMGRVVILQGLLHLTAKGSSTGTAQITGFPFARVTADGTGLIGFYSGLSGITGALSLLSNPTSTAANLYQGGAAASAALTDANFTDSGRVWFCIAYESA